MSFLFLVFVSVVLDDPRKKMSIFLISRVFRASSQQELSKVVSLIIFFRGVDEKKGIALST
jgi:hypothetical protein